MTVTIGERQIRDGAGNLINRKLVDLSGTGAGPWIAIQFFANADGSGVIDFEALSANQIAAINALATRLGEVQVSPTANTVLDRLKAIATGLGAVVLAAGTAVIGKVGLQVGGADVARSNALPVQAPQPLTYTKVGGSPFTLAAGVWTKVATTDISTKGLRIAPIASTSVYDIEWVSVAAGAAAPTDTYGEPILAGETFGDGLPIGDIYLRSASGQIAIVKTGA